MAGPLGGRQRQRHLRRLRRRDVVTTREGWLVDLAGPDRLAAIRALAEDQGDDVERALVDVLADPLDEVRAEAVATLERRGSVAAADRCAAAAPAWDPARYRASREAAWRLLAACGDRSQIDSLVAGLLLSDPGPGIDPGALLALDAMTDGDPDAARSGLTRALQCLEHEDAGVHARARTLTVHLGRLDPAPVAAALGDDRRAAGAALALGDIGDLAYTSDLGALLAPGRPAAVRAAAAAALGALGGHAAARRLQAVVDDRDPVVRRAATDALAPLAPLMAAPALAEREDDAPAAPVPADVAGDEPIAWVTPQREEPAGLVEEAGDPEADVAAAHWPEPEPEPEPAPEPEPEPEPAPEPEPELQTPEPEPEEPDVRGPAEGAPAAEAMKPEPNGHGVPGHISREPVIVPRPIVLPAPPPRREHGATAVALSPAAQEEEEVAPEIAAVDPVAVAPVAEPEAVPESEPHAAEPAVAPEPEVAIEPASPSGEEPGAAAPVDPAPAPDPPASRWLSDRGPIPAGPPPRPRGARRPKRRR